MNKPLMLLNQQNTKKVLLTDVDGHPAPKQVSGEAIAWINEVATAVCRNLVVSGRRSPSGRLMAPKYQPKLMADKAGDQEPPLTMKERAIADIMRPTPERLCARAKETLAENGGERQKDTTDWRMAVFNGETELGLEAWRAEQA